MLKFDSKKMFKDIIEFCVIPAADDAINAFATEAGQNLGKYNRQGEDFDVYDAEFQSAENHVVATCVFYAKAIMESFGKGATMDMKNDELTDYMSGELWNKLRNKSNPKIVGRSAGTYTNIFGEVVESKGKYAGEPVPGAFGKDKKPNYAIQNALKHFDKRIEKAITINADNFFNNRDFSVYFDDGT